MNDTRTDDEVTRDVYHGMTVGLGKSGIMIPEANELLAGGDFSNLTPKLTGVRDGLVELGYLRMRPQGPGYDRIDLPAHS